MRLFWFSLIMGSVGFFILFMTLAWKFETPESDNRGEWWLVLVVLCLSAFYVAITEMAFASYFN